MSDADFVARPEHFLKYLRTTLGLRASDTRLPWSAVLVFGGQDFRAFRRLLGAEPVPWSRRVCRGHAGRVPVAVARSFIGAPAAAVTMEEMAVLGTRAFVAFGACGSLREDLRIGSVVLPTFAHPDEGTSRHYDGLRRPRPDRALHEALGAACARRSLAHVTGGVWTTDAPYRESLRRVRSLARQGVVAVDMEASAIYAVARVRGLKAASLMVVSDELGGDGWNPGFRHAAYLASKRKALRVVRDVLAGTSA